MLRLQRVCLILLAFLYGSHGANWTRTESKRRVKRRKSRNLLTVANSPKPGREIARIRGGFDIDTPFSWLGAFSMNGTVVCGCVLVHSDIVLTTADCVDDAAGFPSSVRIGSLQINSGGALVGVAGGTLHPDWTGDPTKGADLAIMRLDSFLTNTVAIVNTDPRVPQTSEEDLFMAGFGLVNDTAFPDILQGVFLENVENCFERAPPVYNPEFHFCGDATPAKGTCPGDSGTPVLIPGTRLLVGLNSFSDRPCEMQTIDVYTRISSYSLWIQQMICTMSAEPPAICEELNGDICLWESIINAITQFFGI